jgi:membrane protein
MILSFLSYLAPHLLPFRMTKLERIILTSAPFRFMRNRSKKLILPGFEGLPLYDVWRFFLGQIRRVGLNERAAAISFNFLMALPATMIFLFTIIPFLPIAKQIHAELITLTHDLTPNQNTYKLINGIISDFMNKPRGSLSVFGFLLVVFYASNAMMGIMRSFNRSLHESRRRRFYEDRWTAIRLTTLMLVLILASIIILISQGALLTMILKWMSVTSVKVKWLIKSLRWIVIGAMFFYSIAIIYKYAPAVHKRWKLSSPGAIFATVLILITTALFSYWVNHFAAYNKIYGSLGTVLVLMALTFFNSLVLLIGFELNVSISALKTQASKRTKNEINGKEES